VRDQSMFLRKRGRGISAWRQQCSRRLASRPRLLPSVVRRGWRGTDLMSQEVRFARIVIQKKNERVSELAIRETRRLPTLLSRIAVLVELQINSQGVNPLSNVRNASLADEFAGCVPLRPQVFHEPAEELLDFRRSRQGRDALRRMRRLPLRLSRPSCDPPNGSCSVCARTKASDYLTRRAKVVKQDETAVVLSSESRHGCRDSGLVESGTIGGSFY
jgi:hypothetical protein